MEAVAGAQHVPALGPVVAGPKLRLPAAVGPLVANAAGGETRPVARAVRIVAELHPAFGFPQPRFLAAQQTPAERRELEVVRPGGIVELDGEQVVCLAGDGLVGGP